MRKGAFAVFVIGGLLALGACKPTDSNTVELTIFHTNDLHSHLRATKADPFGLGGLARLSTLLQRLRATTPVSLTLDAGDWSEGTWYYNIDEGANMLRFLTMLGYDATCLGNHDFLNGPDQIIKTISSAQPGFPVLAANLDLSQYANATKLSPLLPATAIKTVGGLKVGLIGLTTFDPTYSGYIAPVNILNPIDIATTLANELRPQVDVLILISHNAFTTNEELAQAVPGVDAVISGHTHLKVAQAVLVQNAGKQVPVVETGAWGKFLGDLKLSVDTTHHTVQFKSYRLQAVSPDLAEDPAVAQEVDAQDAALNKQYSDDVSRVVAHADFDLLRSDTAESPLGNLAVKAYRSATGSDLSLEEISLTGVDLAQGPLTLMDLHDVIPHIYNPTTGREWTLNVWNARGSDLVLAFNIFYTMSGLMPLSSPLGWLSVDNVQIVWDPSLRGAGSLGPAVKRISVGGSLLDPAQRYTATITSGLLYALQMANKDFSLGVDLSQVTDTGIEAWRSVVNYATSAKELSSGVLGVGGHALTAQANLAINYYGINWDDHELSVEVDNNGESASVPAQVTCSSGLPNDPVSFDTSLQKWTRIGQVSIPAINAGSSMIVQMPWDSSKLVSGLWPVQCGVMMSGDPYTANNTAERVFTWLPGP